MRSRGAAQSIAIDRDLLLYHALGYATLLTAALAVNSVTNNWVFLVGSAVVALVGHSASLAMRRAGRTSRVIEVVVFGICLTVYLRLISTPYELAALIPGSIDAPQLRFAELLVWIECLRSFTLTSNEAVLFTGVTSIASLGLVATDNIEPEMMVYFGLYVVFSVATLTCYSAVRARRPGAPTSAGPALMQFRLPIIVTILAVGGGWLLAKPMQIASIAVLKQTIPQLAARGIVRLPSFGPSLTSVPVMPGPAYLSDVELLTVKADRPCLWRSSVYTTYSGTAWDNPFWRIRSLKRDEPIRKSNGLFRQVFTFRNGFRTSELFAAAEPIVIRIIRPHRDLTIFTDNYNCWGAGRRSTFEYEALSALPEDSPARLARAGAKYPSEIARVYLQKASLTKDNPVRALALRITRDCSNPYGKAVAIESYLSREYTYDLNPPRAPEGKDVVEFFLFGAKRGYCTAFASAMVVMLREIGIPARLATGFAPGRYDASRGVYVALERDRHAWAEVYFPKCGWITFDPAGAEDERPQGFWSLVGVEITKSMRRMFGGRPWAPIGVLLVLTLVCLARPDLAARRISMRRARSVDPAHRAILKYYESMCRMASRTGARRNRDQTPSEYVSALSRHLPSGGAGDLVEEITRSFERVKYGGETPDRVAIEEMKLTVRALRRSLRRLPRGR